MLIIRWHHHTWKHAERFQQIHNTVYMPTNLFLAWLRIEPKPRLADNRRDAMRHRLVDEWAWPGVLRLKDHILQTEDSSHLLRFRGHVAKAFQVDCMHQMRLGDFPASQIDMEIRAQDHIRKKLVRQNVRNGAVWTAWEELVDVLPVKRAQGLREGEHWRAELKHGHVDDGYHDQLARQLLWVNLSINPPCSFNATILKWEQSCRHSQSGPI
mmetsp:Transcript_44123/g.111720  ORF Transcript_44123/g.111720 Transcript_44123/m.111720 type:complete len:212 (+) Transcript_44123:150-785(+)